MRPQRGAAPLDAGAFLPAEPLRSLPQRRPGTKARQVLTALLKIGWHVKRQSGSHRTLTRPDCPDVVFAFHDDEEIGPKMLETASL